MRLILNIGLDVNGTRAIAAHVALEVIKANGFLVLRHAVHESDTEATLVAVVQPDPLTILREAGGLHFACHCIASDLQQDCIAVHRPMHGDGLQGALAGPRAAKWGRFDPTCFLQINGERLAPVTAEA